MKVKYIDQEDDVYYTLKRTGGIKDGKSSYRASVEHEDKIDVLEDEKFAQDMALSPANVRAVMTSVLDKVVRDVMTDGITRTIGGLLDVRMDIKGRFEREDEEFDPEKHKICLNVRLRHKLSKHYRRCQDPINTENKARGRIDHVTYPGGGLGRIKVGADILIRGKDLQLEPGELVTLSYNGKEKDRNGTLKVKRKFCNVGIFDNELKYFQKISPDELIVKWFVPEYVLEEIEQMGDKAQPRLHVRRNNLFNGISSLEPRGSCVEVRILH